jgi:hypothetical protein
MIETGKGLIFRFRLFDNYNFSIALSKLRVNEPSLEANLSALPFSNVNWCGILARKRVRGTRKRRSGDKPPHLYPGEKFQAAKEPAAWTHFRC